jgi:hypothetical protein
VAQVAFFMVFLALFPLRKNFSDRNRRNKFRFLFANTVLSLAATRTRLNTVSRLFTNSQLSCNGPASVYE